MSLVQLTYGTSGTWRFTAANERKLMIPGACAVAALKLSSGAGAASVAVYDSANDDLNGKALKWFLDCSTTDNDSCIFVSPIEFKKGVLLVAEQGGDLGAIVCVERTGGSPD